MSLTKDQYKQLLDTKLADILDEALKAGKGSNQDEMVAKLSEKFPGYSAAVDAIMDSKEKVANALASCQILASRNPHNGDPKENVQFLIELNQSKYKDVYLDILKMSHMAGFELGFILATMGAQQSSGDDEFDKFMKSIGMNADLGDLPKQ